LLIDASFPEIASAVYLFVATSRVAIREQAEPRYVKGAFDRYVPDSLD